MLPSPFAPATTFPSFISSVRSHLARPSVRIPISFFLLGLLNNVLYVILLSAALDLVGPSIPKSAVLLFDVLPSFLLKLIAPYFIHRVPYRSRVLLCTALAFSGMVIVAASPSTTPVVVAQSKTVQALGKLHDWLKNDDKPPQPPLHALAPKMLGVVLASLSSGLGELSFLSLTALYGPSSLAAWGSGTGAAGLVGAGAYVIATSTLRWSSRTALAAFAILPLGLVVTFFGILPRVERFPLRETQHQSSTDNDVDESDATVEAVESQGLLSQDVAKPFEQPSLAANLRRAKSLVLPYMLPLFLVYVAEYTINQGLTPVLLYDLGATPFEHYRDFYPTYAFLYQVGVFISRSSLPFLRVDALYLPSLLQWLNLAILAAQAMTSTVLPSVWLVFVIVLWEGLLGGLVYVSTFRRIGEEVPEEEREFSLAATTVSDSGGICLAGFVGMAVESSVCGWQVRQGRDWCRRL